MFKSIRFNILRVYGFTLLVIFILTSCTSDFEKRVSLEKGLYKILSKASDDSIKDAKEFKDTFKQMSETNGTSVYNLGIFNKYNSILKRYFKPNDTVILEIGPGSNLLSGVLFALSGVKKYYAVDIYRPEGFYTPLPFNTLSLLLNKLYPDIQVISKEKVYTISNNKVKLNSNKIEYIYPHSVANFPMKDNSVDLVFSQACFEHFEYPDKAIKKITSVLKKGGVTAHQIDLRDHSNFSKPYEFLKESRKEWREGVDEDKLHLYTNQWRAKDFIESFKKHGFKILKVDKQLPSKEHMLTEELRKTFHKDFDKYTFEELVPVGLFIVAKKE